jgi:hypothetical protein
VKRLSEQTLYEILEVDAAAPGPEIASAYERARSLYGPGSLATYSLMTPEEAALLTSRIEEAGRTLLDPEARARYDRSLTPPDEGELRAAVNAHAGPGGAHGTNGTTGPFTLPPVIPALQPASPGPAAISPEPEAATSPSPERSEPSAPAVAAVPPPTLPPEAPPAPIRLEREIHPLVAPATEPPAERAAEAPPAAPAAPEAPPTAAPAIPLPEGAQWTGEALRKVREARGITVQQIADRTKVTRYHVENVEAERFSALPAPVYLRGILLSLARELRLDGQKVARAYLERSAAALAKK